MVSGWQLWFSQSRVLAQSCCSGRSAAKGKHLVCIGADQIFEIEESVGKGNSLYGHVGNMVQLRIRVEESCACEQHIFRMLFRSLQSFTAKEPCRCPGGTRKVGGDKSDRMPNRLKSDCWEVWHNINVFPQAHTHAYSTGGALVSGTTCQGTSSSNHTAGMRSKFTYWACTSIHFQTIRLYAFFLV